MPQSIFPTSTPEQTRPTPAQLAVMKRRQSAFAEQDKRRTELAKIRQQIHELEQKKTDALEHAVLLDALRRAEKSLADALNLKKTITKRRTPTGVEVSPTEIVNAPSPTPEDVSLSRSEIERIEQRQRDAIDFILNEKYERAMKDLGLPTRLVADAERRADAARAATNRQ